MKTWNRFLPAGFRLLAALLVAALCATNASAQYAKLLTKETFSSGNLPDGWNANWGSDNQYPGQWFPNTVNPSGSGGSAMDDIWDYNDQPLTTPSVDASSYTAEGDSVWVDFDMFWEYNGYDYEYQYDFGYTLDEFEIDANSDVLVSGTTDQLYTYYNSNDYNYDVASSSSSNWQHYHILIPVEDRTSNMQINFLGNYDAYPGPGLSDVAITNVTITAYPPPPEAELSLTPKTLSFGTTTPNAPVTLYANVQNVGSAPLIINNTSLSGSSAYSVVSGPENGSAVAPGSTVQYGIQFVPLSNGALIGTFYVATSGVDSGTQQVNLTGIGAVPSVSYSATNMFRGVNVELTKTSTVHYLYVNSVGFGPLSVNSVYFYGINSTDYSVTHLPVGPIAPGGVDSIGVVFTPDFEGLPDAHMVINSTAINNPIDTVTMDGVGILPHLTINNSYPNPITINFDSVPVGVDSCMTILLTNPGSDTIAITHNYFQSADYDFSLTPLTGPDTLIPPGGSQNIQVCFTPLKPGYRLASLRITTNIPLTQTKPPQDTSSFVVNFIGTGVPTGGFYITGPETNGNVMVGDVQGCVTDTIWNSGATTITITKGVISGANVNNFDAGYLQLQWPIVLAPYSHQTFTECASPDDSGIRTALMTLYGSSGEGVSDSASLALSVYGLLVNDTGVNTQPFLTEQCGPDTAIFTVMNTGNVPETYTAGVTGAGYALVGPANSSVENTGGVATFKVAFTGIGPAAGTLNITGGVTVTFPFSTTGGSAVVGGSGTAPLTTVGMTSDSFLVVINNTGTCPWTPGPGQTATNSVFTYSSGGTTPIAGGGSANEYFTYSPTKAGIDTATVNFPNQAGVVSPTPIVSLTGSSTTAGVATVAESNGYSLDQNYPNPFSGSSELSITLPVGGMVNLSIINVEGQVVQTVLNQHFDAGMFGVTLKADGLASGTYYYQMSAGGVTLTRQMVILK